MSALVSNGVRWLTFGTSSGEIAKVVCSSACDLVSATTLCLLYGYLLTHSCKCGPTSWFPEIVGGIFFVRFRCHSVRQVVKLFRGDALPQSNLARVIAGNMSLQGFHIYTSWSVFQAL
jgi:hypothetical protein